MTYPCPDCGLSGRPSLASACAACARGRAPDAAIFIPVADPTREISKLELAEVLELCRDDEPPPTRRVVGFDPWELDLPDELMAAPRSLA